MGQTLTTKKVAIIGIGGIGALHAGILASLRNCSLVAAADQESRLVRAATKAVPTVCFHTDVGEMLADHHPDVVYICTPPASHLQIAREVLESPQRPSALFVEKPLATNTHEAEQLATLAREHNTTTMVGYQRRFLPTVRKARQLIDRGEIGTVLLARCHHFAEGVYEQGEGWRFDDESGGATLELGVHLLDTMVFLFGEPEVTFTRSRRIVSTSCEDYTHAWLKFDRCSAALFEVGWSMWGFNPGDFRVEVYGSKGGVILTQDEVILFTRRGKNNPRPATQTFTSFQLTPRLPILMGGVENVLIDIEFVDCVTSGRTPEVTFDDGVRINRVLDAIRRLAGRD